MIEDEVRAAIKNAAAEADLPVGDRDIKLEHPAVLNHGDFATNLALGMAKKLRRQPLEVAKEIAKHISSDLFSKVEAAAPGFVNIWLSDAFLANEATRIARDGNNYGAPRGRRERILIEHTQVNPNKEPHVGHLRNTCIGDAIMRTEKFAGRDAKAVYYHNDVGQQIAAILLAEQKSFIQPDDFPTRIAWASAAYADIEKRLETDETLSREKEEIQIKIAAQNTEEAVRAERLTLEILHETLNILKEIDVSFDLIVRESDILKGKFWEKTFDLLKAKPAFYKATEGERKDCWVIKMPDAEDKIVVRSNGVPTYVGNDIANHLWKFGVLPDFRYEKLDWKTQDEPLYITTSSSGEERHDFAGANSIINVIDQTQTYPQEAVIESLRVLGFTKEAEHYHHVNYGFVYLSRKTAEKFGMPIEDGASQVKISGRRGTTVSVQQFLENMENSLREKYGDFETITAVRNGAIKFELLKYDTYQDVVFDLDAALDIHGFSGPYVQYASTRAKSVLAKAAGIKEKMGSEPLPESEKNYPPHALSFSRDRRNNIDRSCAAQALSLSL